PSSRLPKRPRQRAGRAGRSGTMACSPLPQWVRGLGRSCRTLLGQVGHELTANELGVRRRNRLGDRLLVAGPVDAHSDPPLLDGALAATVSVDRDIRAVVVGAVSPATHSPAVGLVCRLCSIEA